MTLLINFLMITDQSETNQIYIGKTEGSKIHITYLHFLRFFNVQ